MGKLLGPLIVYLVQIPVLIGCERGIVPVHPMIIVLPLVVFLNARIDQRGADGLGLNTFPSRRALLMILTLGLLSLGGRLFALRLAGVSLRVPSITRASATSLVTDLAVDILVIALWEEIVNRGYVQTRLQEAWGLRGVVLTALLFGSLHLPSAVSAYGWTWLVLFHAVRSGLAGLILGGVYWWTGSVPGTILLHGLDNVGFSVGQVLSGMSGATLQVIAPGFQAFWLVVQTAVMLLFGRMVLCRQVAERPRFKDERS